MKSLISFTPSIGVVSIGFLIIWLAIGILLVRRDKKEQEEDEQEYQEYLQTVKEIEDLEFRKRMEETKASRPKTIHPTIERPSSIIPKSSDNI